MMKEGIEFINAEPGIVADYLKSVGRTKLDVKPSCLKIATYGPELYLQVFNSGIKEYPVRKAFLYKLLGWYNFPAAQIRRLSHETVTSICNDFLMNIKREFVTVKIEDGDAVTIYSPDYNEITDLDIIKYCSVIGIKKISRNDFFLRITTTERMKTEPVPGDECGIGLNIINSETGFRALSVSHFIFRYVCSNGAVAKISGGDYRKYHYGKEDLNKFLKNEVTKSSIERTRIARKLKKLNDVRGAAAEKYIHKMEQRLGKKETAEILSTGGGEMTGYEIFNMITEAAKSHGLSRRFFLESLAGEMIISRQEQ
jgi:hypothetical protein